MKVERQYSLREAARQITAGVTLLIALEFVAINAHAQTTPVLSGIVAYEFRQEGIPLQRTKRIAVLDLQVRMTYATGTPPANYPDADKLVPDAISFIQTYPDKGAYFEVIASALAEELLKKHAVVEQVHVAIDVYRDSVRSYMRKAIAELRRASP